MTTKKLTKLLALYLPYILLGLVATNFGEAWRLAEGKELGDKIMSMMGTVPLAFANPLPSLHPLDILVGLCCGAGLRLAVYLRSKNAKKYRHGMEYGSARWGTAKDIEPFMAPKFADNIILTKTERLMMSNRPPDPKNARNKNVLVVGGSGSGKTRFWLKPNLLQCHSSYVVTDPKGSIVVECGNALLKNGYKLKILNTINFSKSMHYNPFAYVHSEKDILKLVTTLMTNTKGDGSGGDPFWEKSERLLLTALIAYLHYEAPVEEQNFATLLEMLNTMQVLEDDEELEVFLGITPEDMDEAVPRTRRTVNREKVTDHHAILPTRSMLQADLEALPKGEQNVLKLIIARTLMAVSKPFRYLETLLTTECAGEEFTAKGKEVLEEGWKAVERKVLADILNRKQELTALPNAAENECGILNAELKEGQTSPPKHFTEDTLLHAMETASADSMPEGVERQGIGTPATRAATIEKLVQKGFLERKGNKKTKVLLPTDKGKALITVMPEEMQSADMTADWEAKLLQIERGEMEPETFMTEIKEMISSLVTTTEAAKGANALMKNKIIGVCPNCGKPVVEREKGWFCENRECRFVLWKDNAFFKRLGKRLDAHVADKLLRDGRVRLKDCKSAKGKTYNATVLLSCEADGRSKFSLEFEGGC